MLWLDNQHPIALTRLALPAPEYVVVAVGPVGPKEGSWHGGTYVGVVATGEERSKRDMFID